MKRAALFSFVLLAACGNKNNQSTADAGVLGDAAATDGAAPLMPLPFQMVPFTDWLHRYTVEVPATYTKLEQKNCNDTSCQAGVTFSNDDILFTVGGAPTGMDLRGRVSGLKQAGCTNIETKPRGQDWWLKGDTTKTAQPQHFVSAQKHGFGDVMSYNVQGPPAKAALIDALAARIDATFDVAQTKPDNYCKALPWSSEGGANPPPQTFTGKLVVGQGFNGKGVDEKPYILQVDQPFCDSSGHAAWELHTFAGTKGPIDFKPLVDKTVEATGDIDTPMTAHHHRPILLEVSKITAK